MDARREDGQALPLALGGAFALIAGGAGAGRDRRRGDREGAGSSGRRTWRRSRRRARCATTCRGCSRRRPCPTACRTRATSRRPPTWRGRERRRSTRRGRTASAPRACGSRFPDAASFAPVRARAAVLAELAVGGGRTRVEASAVAEAARRRRLPAARCRRWRAAAATAAPLVYRQGEGMRPDVAAAFDRMAAAAAGDGLTLIVNSGFRSDAEQAALFAAHPDPTGSRRRASRCTAARPSSTSGPESAYGWLAANASRFGFVQRYSLGGLALRLRRRPAALLGGRQRRSGAGGGDGALAGGGGLPAFVPARFRAPLLRAAARWNVSAALLAAQLMAESNFNPYAGSPAGAQGIAQFIPSTAAAYGLARPLRPGRGDRCPGPPDVRPDPPARLPQLALAAYNAGPAPVEACDCVPAYPRDPGLRQPHPRPARRRRRPASSPASKCGWWRERFEHADGVDPPTARSTASPTPLIEHADGRTEHRRQRPDPLDRAVAM